MGVGSNGLGCMRGLGNLGTLQLVLYVPRQRNNGVFANALFYEVAVGVVAIALVFKNF